jgi:hypothetical protein
MTVDELRAFDLEAISSYVARSGHRELSRRQMLRLAGRVGVSSAAIPLVAWLAACGQASPARTPSPSPQGSLKPELRGLIDRGGVPEYDWMLGYVRDTDWSDLQASAGGPLITSNPLFSDIVACRAFNAAHPDQPPRGLKLRTGRAAGAPPDVKRIGGGPYAVVDPANAGTAATGGATGYVGAFWLPEYQEAYADFQNKLAAEFDAVPELREVTMALPALIYEEPFRRYSTNVLAQGGWTLALDQQSFTAMLTSHQVWKTTRQDLAYNPYSAPGGNPYWCVTFLKSARQMYGRQLVNGNNSIRATTQDSPMYEAITDAGAPIYFQTAALSRLGSVAATLAFAVEHKANSVELPEYSSMPESLLMQYHNSLMAEPT